LLLNYQAVDTIETWDLLEALENCAVEFGSAGLENLIASIMEIEKRDIAAYIGHFSEEFRFLFSRTREALAAARS
jgi:hypothetical protein